jgi:inosine-uridine nucleoside N-ribohydrolase
MPTRVILDTDIGTDVDDCLALALLLASPELKLEGVTCVYGDVDLRVHMAEKLLALRGLKDVPVRAGARKPLLGLREVYWEGHEGQGLLTEADHQKAISPEFAPDFLVRSIMENPGQIHLIAIGPLTNVALAFLKEPSLAKNLSHLTVMGGVLRGMHDLSLPYAEHNIKCDPEAAHIVFSSGAPISLIPLDTTVQVRVTSEGLERIRAAGTPFHEAIAGQVERYPRFQAQGWTNLHDPLAAASVIRPNLVEFTPLHLDVELVGTFTAGATLMQTSIGKAKANVRVALRVNVAEFEEFFVGRTAQ